MSRVWIIYVKGEPIAAIDDENEAKKEFRYLAFHGDGYQLKSLEVEKKCGGYAEMGDT